jgi:uncharacterized protein involved in type VI secretion and phage assembly
MDRDSTLEEMVGMLERCFYGKYRGQVVDNRDPTSRGRLEVKVPAVLGTQAVWALPCVPYAGANAGFFALPSVGTGVWVEFEAGHLSYPIWTGCYWKDGDLDPADASPSIKLFRTERVSLRIDDDAGTVELSVDGGATLKLSVTALEAKAQSISHEAGTKKTTLSPVHFDVHNGAFTVV